MYNISIKPDNRFLKSFEEQLSFLNQLNINVIEMDDIIDNIKLIDLSGEQTEKYRNLLIIHNVKIVLMNTAIPFDNINEYRLLFKISHLLKVEYIRLSIDSKSMNNQLIEKFEEILKLGRSYNIVCVIENSSDMFNENDLLQTRLFYNYREYNLGLIFNPLEIVKNKRHPFFHVFYKGKFKNNIFFLRINDGLFSDGSPIDLGHGNAEIKELISALLARNFRGWFSIDPYLKMDDLDEISLTLDIFKKIIMNI